MEKGGSQRLQSSQTEPTLIHHQPTIDDKGLRTSLYVPKLCSYVDSLKNGSGDETR